MCPTATAPVNEDQPASAGIPKTAASLRHLIRVAKGERLTLRELASVLLRVEDEAREQVLAVVAEEAAA